MGYEYGDAQNMAIRCFLNQFSKNFNYFDKNYELKTLEYFNYKCPYTGVALTSANMVKDHVIPFNKDCCGLHVYGNVLIVDRKANNDKSSKNLEEYLKNNPERLLKIQEFIKSTGYPEIHNEYNEYLHNTCSELYSGIRYIIEERCTTFQNKYLKTTPKQQILVQKMSTPRTIIYKKAQTNIQKTPNKVNKSLTKDKIKYLCKENGVIINSSFTMASKNSTQNKYWANPQKLFLSKPWTLVLNDNINNILYCFLIPTNSRLEHQIKVRKDNNNQMDLQIYYQDNSFTDSRSGISFAKWLVKTIKY